IQEEHGELVVGRAMGQLLPGVPGIAALPYLAAPAHTEPDVFVDEVQVEYAGGAVRRVLPSGAAVGGAVETPVHVTAGHQVVVLPEAPGCPDRHVGCALCLPGCEIVVGAGVGAHASTLYTQAI